jgi:hypothetical protein
LLPFATPLGRRLGPSTRFCLWYTGSLYAEGRWSAAAAAAAVLLLMLQSPRRQRCAGEIWTKMDESSLIGLPHLATPPPSAWSGFRRCQAPCRGGVTAHGSNFRPNVQNCAPLAVATARNARMLHKGQGSARPGGLTSHQLLPSSVQCEAPSMPCAGNVCIRGLVGEGCGVAYRGGCWQPRCQICPRYRYRTLGAS